MGGFRAIIKAAELATGPEKIVIKAVQIQGRQHEPEKIDRTKLEKIAQNCLSSYGIDFDTYYYVKNKSDIELMDIITQYNMDN